jgi:hypothetical protein
MIGDPTLIMLKAVNMVFPPASIYPQVKEFGISMALLNIGNSSTLLLFRPLHHGKGNHLFL